MGSKADPNARVTDFDNVAAAKPLPLAKNVEPGSTEVARSNDSATGDLAFITKNNELDEKYQLPGGGANANATWVRLTSLS